MNEGGSGTYLRPCSPFPFPFKKRQKNKQMCQCDRGCFQSAAHNPLLPWESLRWGLLLPWLSRTAQLRQCGATLFLETWKGDYG